MADAIEDFFYTAAVDDADAFWKAVGTAFREARNSRGLDEKQVRRNRGPNERTIKAIEDGEMRVQTRTLDEYARAIDYPLATIFMAACRHITSDALLLAEQFAGLQDQELRRSLLKIVTVELERQRVDQANRYPPRSR